MSFGDQASTVGSQRCGSFTLSTGAWTYTLNNEVVQFLVAGQSRSDSITYTATDGTTQTVSVTIAGADDAPLAGAVLASEVAALLQDAGATAVDVQDSVQEIQSHWGDLKSLYQSGKLHSISKVAPLSDLASLQLTDFSSESLGALQTLLPYFDVNLTVPGGVWLGSEEEQFLLGLEQAHAVALAPGPAITVSFMPAWTNLGTDSNLFQRINDGLVSGSISGFGYDESKELLLGQTIPLEKLAQQVTHPDLLAYFASPQLQMYINSAPTSFLNAADYAGFFNSALYDVMRKHSTGQWGDNWVIADGKMKLQDALQNTLDQLISQTNPLGTAYVAEALANGSLISISDESPGSLSLSVAQAVAALPVLTALHQYPVTLSISGSADDFAGLSAPQWTSLQEFDTELQLTELGSGQALTIAMQITDLDLSGLAGMQISSIADNSDGHTVVTLLDADQNSFVITLAQSLDPSLVYAPVNLPALRSMVFGLNELELPPPDQAEGDGVVLTLGTEQFAQDRAALAETAASYSVYLVASLDSNTPADEIAGWVDLINDAAALHIARFSLVDLSGEPIHMLTVSSGEQLQALQALGAALVDAGILTGLSFEPLTALTLEDGLAATLHDAAVLQAAPSPRLEIDVDVAASQMHLSLKAMQDLGVDHVNVDHAVFLGLGVQQASLSDLSSILSAFAPFSQTGSHLFGTQGAVLVLDGDSLAPMQSGSDESLALLCQLLQLGVEHLEVVTGPSSIMAFDITEQALVEVDLSTLGAQPAYLAELLFPPGQNLSILNF